MGREGVLYTWNDSVVCRISCFPSQSSDVYLLFLSEIFELDLSFFPFDAQTCKIILTQWVYPVGSINFTVPLGDGAFSKETYEENGEWSVVQTLGHTEQRGARSLALFQL